MKKNSKKSNFRIEIFSKFEYTTSFIIFVLVFIYLVVQVFVMGFSPTLKAHEVEVSTMYDSTSYTGLVFREEQLITANQAGYIQQFYPENTRVQHGTMVSVISQNPVLQTQLSSEQPITIDKLTKSQVLQHIHSYADNYTSMNFRDTYHLYDKLYTTLYKEQEKLRAQELDALYANQDSSSGVYKAPVAGIINYTLDGFEGITLDAFQEEMMEFSEINTKFMTSGIQVEANQPLYKLITNENWSIVIELTKEDLDKIKNKNHITVKFIQDNQLMDATVTLLEGTSSTFAILEFNSGMIRYASERILDLDIIHTSVEGLKIPKTAVVEEEFYAIPRTYFIDKDSNNPTTLLMNTKDKIQKEQHNIAKQDETYIYYAKDVFREGTVLIKPESDETLTLDKTVKLPLVYNISRGYDNFECITILGEDADSYIIAEDESVSNFDHIALNGKHVKQKQILI